MPLGTRTRHSAHIPAIAVLAALPLLETASAQNLTQPARAALTFEVASIKVQPPPTRLGSSPQDSIERTPYTTFRGNRFRAANATAAWLIREAYGHDYRLREQVSGGPEWLDQDRFEIDAVARDAQPGGIDSVPTDAVLEMLRSLIQTRFKLRVRPETRDRPVGNRYAIMQRVPCRGCW
jgi:uncharacterized protein (TIGR03435 family)